ncbi:MAG: serine--tRNA ligase [Anaerolineales bacterium]|nr:serine--tRNA ligase [Anaerolineales bacterium]
MLDINLIRENPEVVRAGMRKRGMDPAPVDQAIVLDEQWRDLIQEVEALKAERNTVSKEIGRMKDQTERQAKIEAMRAVADQIKVLDDKVRDAEAELTAVLAIIPNIPDEKVPDGLTDEDNVVVRTVGKIPEFDFEPQAHWDLGPELGIIDFERGVKISGTRFYVLSGAGARLQRALISFFLDLHTTKHGYTEKYVPTLIKGETLFGAGQLPKFKDNLYKDHEEDFYLLPTSEVALTGLHMDEILDEADLPLYYTAYSACFRREKMSAGRDVRGIKRGHQFDKVEMYKYCKPENSAEELEKMVADAEEVCQLLGIPYRVILKCAGDTSETAHISYDLEAWAAGCGEWLEISSVSNVGEFQSRRANIRYRPIEGGKVQYLHTLNGSGLALPRVMIAIIENFQRADGSVAIPEVLHHWMGGTKVIEKDT